MAVIAASHAGNEEEKGRERKDPGTRFLCKKPVPGPSGKNSNIAGGMVSGVYKLVKLEASLTKTDHEGKGAEGYVNHLVG